MFSHSRAALSGEIYMNKAISLILILGIFLSTGVGSFAQKRRTGKEDRIEPNRRPISKVTPAPADTDFGAVEAFSSGRGVLIQWQMKRETANIGFNIFRVDGNGRAIVNSDVIFGSAAKAGRQALYGEQYSFTDRLGEIGSVYAIEAFDLDGKYTYSQSFSAAYSTNFRGRGPAIPVNDNATGKTDNGQLRAAKLDLPKELINELAIQPFVADPVNHRWVVSNPGVRIDVKKEGVYRVPVSQLQAAGFNTVAPSSTWQLYLAGVEQAINIPAGAPYIEFYGRGVDTTETDIQGYFLIAGPGPGKRMQNTVARPSSGTVLLRNYNQTFEFKERTGYVNSILNGDAENYWGRGVNATGTNVNFDLTGVDFTNPQSTLAVKLQGFSSGLHNVRITLNGQLLEQADGIAQFPLEKTQTIPTSLLKDTGLGQGTNVLNLASIGPSGDFSLFDSVSVNFNRKHQASQNTLKAYSLNSRKTQLTGFTSANVRVFDLSFQNEARIVTNLPFSLQGSSFGADLPAARGRVFYAVEDSAILAPFNIVANDGEILGANTQGADLIIIAYKDFLTQAETWANYRRGQGFTVKVVNVDEIFNEFNFGVLSSASIKSFLSYAYGNWQEQPQYVLLMGDASFDSRNYQNAGFFNYVPTPIIVTIFTETGSDESLADFNNDGLSEMAIGRIPARLVSTINTAFAKTVNWEANLTASLNRGALFAYDEPIGFNFQAMSERVRDELPVGTSSTMVFRSQPNAQADLLAAMNTSTGKYIVNYAGHGTTGAWASTAFFWNNTVFSMTNGNNESIFTMLTCLNGYFLSLNGISLAETLLDYGNGGAVAAWGSTGLTTPDVQEIMARRFYRKIGEGSIPRMGDLVKDAKTSIVGGTDVRLSWTLIGDPMLKVR